MKAPNGLGRRTVVEFRKLLLVVFVGMILRCVYVLVVVDLTEDFYWEYGEIVKNLHAGKGYSLFHTGEPRRTHLFDPSATPSPSAFMPPGYVFFLWPFFFVQNILLRNLFILAVQTIISGVVTVGVYFFTEKLVCKGAGLTGAAIAATMPEFVYASSSYTPTVFFHLGILLVLYLLQPEASISRTVRVALFISASTFLIYMRSEIVLFIIVGIFLLMKMTDVRTAAVAALVILLLQLPWQIRNYAVFGEWIPLTTSSGLNFFRGHNEVELGAWSDDVVQSEAKKIPYNSKFEPSLNTLYFKRALEFISEHPANDLVYLGRKFVQYWVLNPDDERSRNPLYVAPWLMLLGLSVSGMFKFRVWMTNRAVFFYLLSSTIIAMVFFVLPRYQTMTKIALVPFAGGALHLLRTKTVGRSTDQKP